MSSVPSTSKHAVLARLRAESEHRENTAFAVGVFVGAFITLGVLAFGIWIL